MTLTINDAALEREPDLTRRIKVTVSAMAMQEDFRAGDATEKGKRIIAQINRP